MLYAIYYSYIICYILNIGNSPHGQKLGNELGKLGYSHLMKYHLAVDASKCFSYKQVKILC